MLTLSVSQIMERLRTADRVLLAVALLAGIALIYATTQGYSWWRSYAQAGDLRTQAYQLQTAIANARTGGSDVGTALRQHQAQLAGQAANLTFTTDDQILGLLGDVARQSHVTLVSASLTNKGMRASGPTTFRVISISARVESQLTSIYGYIDNLRQAMPTTSVVTSHLGFGVAPFATLEIEMLVDPTPTPAGSTK